MSQKLEAEMPIQRPSRKRGAYLLWESEDREVICSWLARYGVTADEYPRERLDDFIRLIESESVEWTVVHSEERGLRGPHFKRLLVALQQTDTDLWAASTNECISIRWVTTLLSVDLQVLEMRQSLREHESFFPIEPQEDVICDIHEMVADLHDVIVGQSSDGTLIDSLTETQRELWKATSEVDPLRAVEICHRARHDLNSHSKAALSQLTKLGLLRKTSAGYIKAP